MKIIIQFLVIGSLLLFSSCKKKNLKYQEVTKSGEIEILLLDVHDSRCPSDLDCIWEGNAEVSLRIMKGNEMVDFSLNTNSSYTQDTVIFDKKVELLKVAPYPASNETYSLGDYKIKLKVTKA